MTDPIGLFIEAACVPLDALHVSGSLDAAEAIRRAHPGLAQQDIHAAAALGDAAAVRAHLARDAARAIARGGPRGWDPLTHLCFSRYLRLDAARSQAFVEAAESLLAAGASARTGWMEESHTPHPVWESVLYGAAGVAHHAGLTRLLLAHGADPNDDETPYHAPEGYDNAAMQVLVESGRMTDDSLATMLLRKADWHDEHGIGWLLEHGADPNRPTRWGRTALQHAVQRDNSAAIITAMLDHEGDPTCGTAGDSAVALAARRGRGDLLALFQGRGPASGLTGADALAAACAHGDTASAHAIAKREPALLAGLVGEAGTLLATFAGNGNTEGVRLLLAFGLDVDARFEEGDAYFDVARHSTALHVAAWRARPATVNLLIERGATVDARDAAQRTPLMLAVRACVDSYWRERRSPESVQALLDAGASIAGVPFPSGYAEVDTLLARHGARAG